MGANRKMTPLHLCRSFMHQSRAETVELLGPKCQWCCTDFFSSLYTTTTTTPCVTGWGSASIDPCICHCPPAPIRPRRVRAESLCCFFHPKKRKEKSWKHFYYLFAMGWWWQGRRWVRNILKLRLNGSSFFFFFFFSTLKLEPTADTQSQIHFSSSWFLSQLHCTALSR